MMDPSAPVVPQEISTDQPVLSDEENARLQVELSQVICSVFRWQSQRPLKR